MGKLKTSRDRLNHKRVVKKHTANGRCYNMVDGLGWNHYTKGFRKHSIHSNVVSRGTIILFGFLARLVGNNDVEKLALTDENINTVEELEKAKEE